MALAPAGSERRVISTSGEGYTRRHDAERAALRANTDTADTINLPPMGD